MLSLNEAKIKQKLGVGICASSASASVHCTMVAVSISNAKVLGDYWQCKCSLALFLCGLFVRLIRICSTINIDWMNECHVLLQYWSHQLLAGPLPFAIAASIAPTLFYLTDYSTLLLIYIKFINEVFFTIKTLLRCLGKWSILLGHPPHDEVNSNQIDSNFNLYLI